MKFMAKFEATRTRTRTRTRTGRQFPPFDFAERIKVANGESGK